MATQDWKASIEYNICILDLTSDNQCPRCVKVFSLICWVFCWCQDVVMAALAETTSQLTTPVGRVSKSGTPPPKEKTQYVISCDIPILWDHFIMNLTTKNKNNMKHDMKKIKKKSPSPRHIYHLFPHYPGASHTSRFVQIFCRVGRTHGKSWCGAQIREGFFHCQTPSSTDGYPPVN